MQTIGPYTLDARLSSCEVGEVWSARDGSDRPFTLAVLDERAATVSGWRDAFAAAASTLARSDGLPIVAADHTGRRPWVACAPERGEGAAHVFLALGQQLLPAPAGTAPDGSGTPAAPDADRPEPAPEEPTVRLDAVPVAGPDAAPGPGPAPEDPGPAVPRPAVDAAPPYPPLPSAPSARRRGRPLLRLALAALVALAVGAAGGFAVGDRRAEDPRPAAAATATPTPDLGLPGTPPQRPGAEPPTGGGWPADAPKFTDTDRTREMAELEGVGFPFRVPADWTCTEAARTTGMVRYTCGVTDAAGALRAGGDLVVRECPRLCTEQRRTELRRQEEAWGLRWVRSGDFTTWAETDRVDGQPRYGLVYLSYWRSVPEDAVDRQLVLRLTAPPDRADDLRKVVNSVRDATFTI